jgi:hypothetical protein
MACTKNGLRRSGEGMFAEKGRSAKPVVQTAKNVWRKK